MSIPSIVAAVALVLLGLAHSVLGELEILQPLFRAEWKDPAPRWAMERLLRFAWHLTSIAWFGLAAAVLGLSIHLAVAGVTLASAAILFVALRGHLAWPLFTIAGLAGLFADGWVTAPALGGAVAAAVTCTVAVAAVHLYWVAGGRWAMEYVIPITAEGVPAFRPPAWATAAVAGALLVFGGLMSWVWLGQPPTSARVLLGLGCAVMTVRAIGDGNLVGFSKTLRTGRFAAWDDRLFTPAAVLMAFGSGAALLG